MSYRAHPGPDELREVGERWAFTPGFHFRPSFAPVFAGLTRARMRHFFLPGLRGVAERAVWASWRCRAARLCPLDADYEAAIFKLGLHGVAERAICASRRCRAARLRPLDADYDAAIFNAGFAALKIGGAGRNRTGA